MDTRKQTNFAHDMTLLGDRQAAKSCDGQYIVPVGPICPLGANPYKARQGSAHGERGPFFPPLL